MQKFLIVLLFINYCIQVLSKEWTTGIATEYGVNSDGSTEIPDLNPPSCSNSHTRIKLTDRIVAVGKDILKCNKEMEIFNEYKDSKGYGTSIIVKMFDECPECNNKNGERIDLPAEIWNELYGKRVYITGKKPVNDLGELPIKWRYVNNTTNTHKSNNRSKTKRKSKNISRTKK